MTFTVPVYQLDRFTQSGDIFTAIKTTNSKDPSSTEFDGGGYGVEGDTLSLSGTAVGLSVDENFIWDGDGKIPGGTLSSNLTLNGKTYAAGAEVETDYAAFFWIQGTSKYVVVNHLSINDEYVGVVTNRIYDDATDTITNDIPAPGDVLVLMDPQGNHPNAPSNAGTQTTAGSTVWQQYTAEDTRQNDGNPANWNLDENGSNGSTGAGFYDNDIDIAVVNVPEPNANPVDGDETETLEAGSVAPIKTDVIDGQTPTTDPDSNPVVLDGGANLDGNGNPFILATTGSAKTLGTVSFSGSDTITYTPSGNEADGDKITLTYRVNDLETGTDLSTITYTVRKDSDGDGVADVDDLDDDNDGILDTDETHGGPADTDGDRVDNRLDLDSDNDGISDLAESGIDPSIVDKDNDGVYDNTTGPNAQVDKNGIPIAARNPNQTNDSPGFDDGDLRDSDKDGVFDFLDLDSDNDGISDYIESQTTADFVPYNSKDSDNDGIIDIVDNTRAGSQFLAVISMAILPIPMGRVNQTIWMMIQTVTGSKILMKVGLTLSGPQQMGSTMGLALLLKTKMARLTQQGPDLVRLKKFWITPVTTMRRTLISDQLR